MYIVFVTFDWTTALSAVCFWFVYNSMNLSIYKSQLRGSAGRIHQLENVKYTKIIQIPTLQSYFSLKIIKIEAYTKPNDVWSLRFKSETFIWRHVVNLPKSSTTCRRILNLCDFRPRICKNIFLCSVLHWRTRKNCFRYLKLMSPRNAAICTTVLSVYTVMSFDFPFVRLFGVR